VEDAKAGDWEEEGGGAEEEAGWEVEVEEGWKWVVVGAEEEGTEEDELDVEEEEGAEVAAEEEEAGEGCDDDDGGDSCAGDDGLGSGVMSVNSRTRYLGRPRWSALRLDEGRRHDGG
jgi:hypothetical protein